ncbi:hypothetical protein ADUPG1_013594 [Aduncisulcus paluster]|uniref:Uncharacterized protein n=1 Tax=Aduncisulcus paluster TaxID=2918883 RepID=A0ABQ5K3J6_9EUKA|nr:hypothetical protein ADUPG1_013594 [Aduncisulcus paluster]
MREDITISEVLDESEGKRFCRDIRSKSALILNELKKISKTINRRKSVSEPMKFFFQPTRDGYKFLFGAKEIGDTPSKASIAALVSSESTINLGDLCRGYGGLFDGVKTVSASSRDNLCFFNSILYLLPHIKYFMSAKELQIHVFRYVLLKSYNDSKPSSKKVPAKPKEKKTDIFRGVIDRFKNGYAKRDELDAISHLIGRSIVVFILQSTSKRPKKGLKRYINFKKYKDSNPLFLFLKHDISDDKSSSKAHYSPIVAESSEFSSRLLEYSLNNYNPGKRTCFESIPLSLITISQSSSIPMFCTDPGGKASSPMIAPKIEEVLLKDHGDLLSEVEVSEVSEGFEKAVKESVKLSPTQKETKEISEKPKKHNPTANPKAGNGNEFCKNIRKSSEKIFQELEELTHKKISKTSERKTFSKAVKILADDAKEIGKKPKVESVNSLVSRTLNLGYLCRGGFDGLFDGVKTVSASSKDNLCFFSSILYLLPCIKCFMSAKELQIHALRYMLLKSFRDQETCKYKNVIDRFKNGHAGNDEIDAISHLIGRSIVVFHKTPYQKDRSSFANISYVHPFNYKKYGPNNLIYLFLESTSICGSNSGHFSPIFITGKRILSEKLSKYFLTSPPQNSEESMSLISDVTPIICHPVSIQKSKKPSKKIKITRPSGQNKSTRVIKKSPKGVDKPIQTPSEMKVKPDDPPLSSSDSYAAIIDAGRDENSLAFVFSQNPQSNQETIEKIGKEIFGSREKFKEKLEKYNETTQKITELLKSHLPNGEINILEYYETHPHNDHCHYYVTKNIYSVAEGKFVSLVDELIANISQANESSVFRRPNLDHFNYWNTTSLEKFLNDLGETPNKAQGDKKREEQQKLQDQLCLKLNIQKYDYRENGNQILNAEVDQQLKQDIKKIISEIRTNNRIKQEEFFQKLTSEKNPHPFRHLNFDEPVSTTHKDFEHKVMTRPAFFDGDQKCPFDITLFIPVDPLFWFGSADNINFLSIGILMSCPLDKILEETADFEESIDSKSPFVPISSPQQPFKAFFTGDMKYFRFDKNCYEKFIQTLDEKSMLCENLFSKYHAANCTFMTIPHHGSSSYSLESFYQCVCGRVLSVPSGKSYGQKEEEYNDFVKEWEEDGAQRLCFAMRNRGSQELCNILEKIEFHIDSEIQEKSDSELQTMLTSHEDTEKEYLQEEIEYRKMSHCSHIKSNPERFLVSVSPLTNALYETLAHRPPLIYVQNCSEHSDSKVSSVIELANNCKDLKYYWKNLKYYLKDVMKIITMFNKHCL